MTHAETSALDALSALLEERRRYEGWLAQLDERRSVAPPHVVDRVQADYRSRLEGVTHQLRGRASELEETVGGLRARIAALQGEENQRRDERAEVELRALVGELAEPDASGTIAACDEAIGALANERGELENQLARLSEVLAQVAAAPPAVELAEALEGGGEAPDGAVEAPEALVDAAFADDEGEAASPGSEPSPMPGAPTGAAASQGEEAPREPGAAPTPSALDELAFLQSIVETREEGAASGRGDESPARSSAGGNDLLPPPVLAAPRRPATPVSAPQTAGGLDALGNQAPAKLPTFTPGSMPSFFKDMPTEQVKTLKCQECGTMNYPTEWYCERCGGELAAM